LYILLLLVAEGKKSVIVRTSRKRKLKLNSTRRLENWAGFFRGREGRAGHAKKEKKERLRWMRR